MQMEIKSRYDNKLNVWALFPHLDDDPETNDELLRQASFVYDHWLGQFGIVQSTWQVVDVIDKHDKNALRYYMDQGATLIQ